MKSTRYQKFVEDRLKSTPYKKLYSLFLKEVKKALTQLRPGYKTRFKIQNLDHEEVQKLVRFIEKKASVYVSNGVLVIQKKKRTLRRD